MFLMSITKSGFSDKKIQDLGKDAVFTNAIEAIFREHFFKRLVIGILTGLGVTTEI
jgi:hypothetical protein